MAATPGTTELSPGRTRPPSGMNGSPESPPKISFAPLFRLIPLFFFFLGLSFFLHGPFSRSGFPLDDAWIHRVYARSIAQGTGFHYNDGTAEAGESSPLWALFTAPAHWFEGQGEQQVVFLVKVLGILCGLIVLHFSHAIILRLFQSSRIAIAASSMLAFDPRFLFATLSGMEPILLLVLWLGAIASLLRNRWERFTLYLSLAPLVRPETLLFLPFSACLLLSGNVKRSMAQRIFLLAFMVAPSLFWGLCCFSISGHFLPNTFYVKSHWLHHGLQTFSLVWGDLTGQGWASPPIFLIGLGAFALRFYHGERKNHFWPLFYLLVLPVIYIFSVVCTRKIFPGGYYYWTRWSDPAALVLIFVFAAGYSCLLFGKTDTDNQPHSPSTRPRLAPLILIVFSWLGLIASGSIFKTTFSDRVRHLESDSRAIQRLNVEAGKWINSHLPASATIGVNDAGAIRYFGKRQTIDLAGLNNAEVLKGDKTLPEILHNLDWIAIFPGWFPEEAVTPFFDFRESFSLPPGEYTITPSRNQNVIAIFEREKGDHFEPITLYREGPPGSSSEDPPPPPGKN